MNAEVDRTPHILVVSSDSSLEGEFLAAKAAVRGLTTKTWFVADVRQGVESARNRQPDLVCVELGKDYSRLKEFASEIANASPNSIVVAIYHPNAIAVENSESEVIVELLRSGIQDFLRRPLSSSELERMVQRLGENREQSQADLGKVVSFVSTKGGVGKSTLACNAAAVLAARHPDQVLLLDASFQLGVCAFMLDLQPETTILDAIRQRDRLDETLLRQLAVPHPSGVRLLAAPNDALEAADIEEESLSRILQLARRSFKYVVVDTFPMLDSLVLAVLDLSDTAYVVLQGTVPNVAGIRRLLKLLPTLGCPTDRVRVALNQNYPPFAGNLRPVDVADQLARDIDHVFPYQKKIMQALNAGRPYGLQAGSRFGFGRALHSLVDEVEGTQSFASRNGRRVVAPGRATGDADAVAGVSA